MSILVEEPRIQVPSLGDDEPLFEIIDGHHVELPPMSAYAAILASYLLGELHHFLKTHHLGRAVMETLFHLALPIDRNRRPDVAFVSYQRWPKNQLQPEKDNAWDVVPNLAVEVVSPSDPAEALMDKVSEYFQADVELVWVFYPRLRLVHVYESWTTARVLTYADALDGASVLPGFQLPLASLFQEKSNGAERHESDS